MMTLIIIFLIINGNYKRFLSEHFLFTQYLKVLSKMLIKQFNEKRFLSPFLILVTNKLLKLFIPIVTLIML